MVLLPVLSIKNHIKVSANEVKKSDIESVSITLNELYESIIITKNIILKNIILFVNI